MSAARRIELKILNPRIGAEMPLPKTRHRGLGRARPARVHRCAARSLARRTVLIPTGIAIHLADPGLAALIMPRSGLGHKHGIVLGNLVGLIDSDYQGRAHDLVLEPRVAAVSIEPGERIAQLVVVPVVPAEFDIVESFAESRRGAGGFGHTGHDDQPPFSSLKRRMSLSNELRTVC